MRKLVCRGSVHLVSSMAPRKCSRQWRTMFSSAKQAMRLCAVHHCKQYFFQFPGYCVSRLFHQWDSTVKLWALVGDVSSKRNARPAHTPICSTKQREPLDIEQAAKFLLLLKLACSSYLFRFMKHVGDMYSLKCAQ